jgi:hypothetical protein
MYLNNFLCILRRHTTYGDTQAVTTATRADTISNVTALQEIDDTLLGTIVVLNRATGVTSRYFQGKGAGAPTFAAAIGSRYMRTDGGAATTLYINEAGSTTWVGK